jgi:serine/threonine protein phosphatase 1
MVKDRMGIEMRNSARFFIGDIHGEARLLEQQLAFIEDECRRLDIVPQVTFLGDIVDRGPDSKLALQLVCATLKLWPGSRLMLGNHDDLFLKVLRRRRLDNYAEQWLKNCGGDRTVSNFTTETFMPLVCQEIERQIPEELEMLHNADLIVRYGPFIACHAGINGMVPLDQQAEDDILWIREGFLDRIDPFMPPVIHGHSITNDFLPTVTENRISLDTGAFVSGRLTSLLLDHEQRSLRFFQTFPEEVIEVEPTVINRGKGTIYGRLRSLYKAHGTSMGGD